LSKKLLAEVLREEFDFSYQVSEQVVDEFFATIKRELKIGNNFIIHGFGSFAVKEHEAKVFQDVHTGKIKALPDRKKVTFRPSKNILKL